MKLVSRDFATSFTTFLFIVMGVTGVLMYFHILDNYTKQMHEILGLAFVAIVFLHVFVNWKAMKSYFSKKMFFISFIVVFAVALGFIFNVADAGPNPKRVMINKLLNAPIEKSFVFLGNDYDEAVMKLEDAGLKIEDGKSIKDLSELNKTSPFAIVDIISK